MYGYRDRIYPYFKSNIAWYMIKELRNQMFCIDTIYTLYWPYEE